MGGLFTWAHRTPHSCEWLHVCIAGTRTHTHIRTHAHIRTHTRAHTHMHMHTHVHTRARAHTRTHTHVHIHAHMHTHTTQLLYILAVTTHSTHMQVGKGVLRILRCHPEGIADIVPVDYVDNMMIAIGWMTGTQKTAKPLIYHCTSGTINPCTWRQMRE